MHGFRSAARSGPGGRDTLLRRLLLVFGAAVGALALAAAAAVVFAVWPHFVALANSARRIINKAPRCAPFRLSRAV